MVNLKHLCSLTWSAMVSLVVFICICVVLFWDHRQKSSGSSPDSTLITSSIVQGDRMRCWGSKSGLQSRANKHIHCTIIPAPFICILMSNYLYIFLHYWTVVNSTYSTYVYLCCWRTSKYFAHLKIHWLLNIDLHSPLCVIGINFL